MSSSPDSSPATKARPPIFDPTIVPIVGRDSHLPKVDDDLLCVDAMRARFLEDRPWDVEVTDENRAARSADLAARFSSVTSTSQGRSSKNLALMASTHKRSSSTFGR